MLSFFLMFINYFNQSLELLCNIPFISHVATGTWETQIYLDIQYLNLESQSICNTCMLSHLYFAVIVFASYQNGFYFWFLFNLGSVAPVGLHVHIVQGCGVTCICCMGFAYLHETSLIVPGVGNFIKTTFKELSPVSQVA